MGPVELSEGQTLAMSSGAAKQQSSAMMPLAVAKMMVLTMTMMSRAVQLLSAEYLLGFLLTPPVGDTDVCVMSRCGSSDEQTV